uniref:Ovule protein n=1 Tax=Mesocestoides corti TaxID=53468 RepID=A0A5K3G3C0_MESCO
PDLIWLRVSSFFHILGVEYPSPSIRSQSHTSGTFHPSPPRWPRRSLYAAPLSCPSLVDCLSFSHAIGTERDTGLAAARWSNVCALIRRHCRIPEP